MTHSPIEWHPWRNNPLDYLGVDLRTPTGKIVRIEKPHYFQLYINNVLTQTMDNNMDVCAVLNELEAGVTR